MKYATDELNDKLNEYLDKQKQLSQAEGLPFESLRESQSLLSCLYGIDIDTVEERLLFRAEYDFERRCCENLSSLTKRAEKIFYKGVYSKKWDHEDVETFSKLLEHLKSQDSVCQDCFRKTHISCEIDNINSILDKKECQRYQFQFHPTDSITGFHESLMAEIIDAVNNQPSIYRSYSKYLAAPLFKYMNFYTGGVLEFSHFSTNTIEASIGLSLCDWYRSLDEKGNEKSQYYGDGFPINFPLKELSHPESILRRIFEHEYIEERLEGNLDNIEMSLTNITVDISKIDRAALDNYCSIHGLNCIKRFSSYKKDAEVLTTIPPNSYAIKNKRVIQLIRYIYLLKIGGIFSKQSLAFVKDILSGKHADKIPLEAHEKKAFEVIWQYLQSSDTIEQEKASYENLFPPGHSYYFRSFCRQGIFDYFEKILNCRTPSAYSKLFENDFLKWMITESHLTL